MKLSWKTCIKILITALLFYICIYFLPDAAKILGALLGAASPLFIGGAIAYIINIIMDRYEKWYFPHSVKKAVAVTRRPVCLTLALLSVAAIIALVVGLVIPQLISCIQLIINKMPDAIRTVIAKLDEWNIIPDNISQSVKDIDWQSWVGQIISMISTGIGNVMSVVVTTVTSVFSVIVTALLSVIFAIYMLCSKEKLLSQADRLLSLVFSKNWYRRTKYVMGILNTSFRSYIIGQSTEAVILGGLCAVGMLILGLPFAAMIGALVAFTALIPVAGAYIGAIVGALMILTESPIKALIFLIFLVVLQQLEGNLIYPRVVGSSLGLPAIWVLAAVTIGGGMMGVMGMLIGVPLAATVYKILKDNANRIPQIKQEIKIK